MKFLFIFAALVAVVMAQSGDHDINPPECGKRPIVDNLVTGGDESKVGGHPHIISMELNGRHICGGSLINRRWVITAAHCVERTSPSSVRVQIGAHDRSNKTEWQVTKNVANIFSHPAYNSITTVNDIALLKLSEKVEYDNTYIIPACLNKDSAVFETSSGVYGWASGWGTTSSGAFTLPTKLREVELPYTKDSDCYNYYGSEYDKANMICFGAIGDGKDTCQGDSGGPVVVKNPTTGLWELTGITSWGYGCGNIGVYSRVSALSAWVEQIIAANSSN